MPCFLFLHFLALIDWHFLKVAENESLSGQNLPAHKQRKLVTLVEDENSFSLSSDYEDFDAEATDRKYEKQKQVIMQKLSKKQNKKKANSALSDDEAFEFGEEEEEEEEEKVEEEKEEEKHIATEDVQNKGVSSEAASFRSKSTVYNTSQLTGW